MGAEGDHDSNAHAWLRQRAWIRILTVCAVEVNAKACSQQRGSRSDKRQREVGPMDKIPCVRCGRRSHALRACSAKAAIHGSPLSQDSGSEELEESEEQEESLCLGCGRTGRWQASRYAHTYADGRRLWRAEYHASECCGTTEEFVSFPSDKRMP